MSAPNGDVRKQVAENDGNEEFVSFPEVIDGKIATEEFLAAAQGIVRMVDKFGKLFAPVKYDMQGNIDKINTKYNSNRQQHLTLQDLILLEKAGGRDLIATDALLWLRRGLYMIQLFFEEIIEDHKAGRRTEDLGAFLKKAYKEALEPFHGWMAQQLFNLIARMVPTKTALLQAMANGKPGQEDITLKDLEVVLIGMKTNVINLCSFYEQYNLNNNARV
ncbi:glycolipid transfer protein [Cephus cinctus]|uniref:Glycolipid transfer protein n=1 Tax=Cephus cinctus TaxID=211228 RepID=A0AAJ7RRE0_CEPCN|nr:glycolipid transfer protein [Cephus cinctus]XP_024945730.1 glycolipid transfer protein [Cephus cinctus]XP_024945731.1 glycolipid transfer protein [Cephus cinctus]